MMTATQKKQIGTLRDEFQGIDRISIDAANKLGRILDACPEAMLVELIKADVPFCAGVACVRLRDRGWEWDEIDALKCL